MEIIVGTGIQWKITFDVESDIQTNTSKVKCTKIEIITTNGKNYGACYITGSVKINGTKTCELVNSTIGSCSLTPNPDRYEGGGEGTWGAFANNYVTVAHGDDGNAEVTIRLSLSLRSTNGTEQSHRSDTIIQQLPMVPRVSGITVTATTFDKPVSIQIDKKNNDFKTKLRWVAGTAQGDITGSAITESSYQYTFPAATAIAICSQYPQLADVRVWFIAETYLGSDLIGSAEYDARISVPDTAIPIIKSIKLSDAKGYTTTYGGYIQMQSILKVEVSANGSYGATIKSISTSAGGSTSSGETSLLQIRSSGTVRVVIIVTDSRGRTNQSIQEITVIPYQRPAAEIIDSYRCDSFGNTQPNGSYMMIRFRGSVTQLTNNKAEWRVVYALHGSEQEMKALLTDYTGQFSVTDGSVVLPANIDNSYDVSIEVTDAFQTVNGLAVLVPVAFISIDFYKNGRAVGIGMRATKQGTVCVGLPMDMYENAIHNIADPVADSDAATKKYIDDQIAAIKQALGIS